MLHKHGIFWCLISLFAMPSLCGLSPTSESRRTVEYGPKFVSLEPDEELFDGTIADEKMVKEVQNISFGGVTKITGVKSEDNDATSVIKLGLVRRIKILDPHYRSPRHSATASGGELRLFIKAQVTFNTGGESEIFLIPHDIMLCAEDKTTGVERAWWLRDIDELSMSQTSAGSPSASKKEEASAAIPEPRTPKKHRGVFAQAWYGVVDSVQWAIQGTKTWLERGS